MRPKATNKILRWKSSELNDYDSLYQNIFSGVKSNNSMYQQRIKIEIFLAQVGNPHV